ncbi:hypothetical protein D3C76_927460 [compost metagenome]
MQRGFGVSEIIAFISTHSELEVPAHVVLTLQQWDREIQRLERVPYSQEGDIFATNMPTDDEQELGTVVECKYVHINDIPMPQSLFPHLEQIPMMWRKEFRSYHMSTVNQMVNQAILWQTKVEIAYDGHKVDFIPLVRSSLDRERIIGEIFNPANNQYEVVEMASSEWKEMRLIIPDVNS